MRTWQLQEAKNRFSEVVGRAEKDGPQVVTRHGKRVAVVISAADFDRTRKRRPSLWEFLRSAPTKGVVLRIERDRSPGRNIKL